LQGEDAGLEEELRERSAEITSAGVRIAGPALEISAGMLPDPTD
jgi:hypothetical protein